jgi:hypothetical protein
LLAILLELHNAKAQVIPVSAHLAGQAPYLRLDGQYTNLYPVPISSAPSFNLPQDVAIGTFTVGKEIQFVMEVGRLPAPPEVVQKTTFTWDFGDGSDKVTGLTAKHTYIKMGSFIQTIYANDGSTPEPQLLSSVLINVLPDPAYKLPTPVLFVNGIAPKDPISDPLKFDLTKSLHFDGSKSVLGTGKIVSYTVDLGDGTTKSDSKFDFAYTTEVYQVFPVLRLRDENGFIADTFVELETGNPLENNAIVKEAENQSQNPGFMGPLGMTLIGIGVVSGILVIVIVFLKKRKKDVKHN